jgi:hypothetical protein
MGLGPVGSRGVASRRNLEVRDRVVVARLCPGVELGQERVVACMKPRSSELDSACRALLFP